MVGHICPLCGNATDKPMLFKSIRLQQLFGFVWDNPNCRTSEVARATGVSHVHVTMLMTEIKRGLEGTEFRLVADRIVTKQGRLARYKIVNYKPPVTPVATEGTTNGNV